MIIDNKQSDVTVIGDIKEFKTGIDPKNLEFITTLLSSNLYSNPEQSFMREIVSNAWDSHVEAGNTDTPVIIQITDNSVTIRDYGTGLSPERFKDVYCNIGSSTKRDTNDFIGGFGIGKYSSLACTNTTYITSFYEGKKYSYIMVKSGNTITTNLVSTLDTTEKNGVEVKINNLFSTKPYIEGLKYLVFFPNIYVDKNVHYYYGYIPDINKVKIKRYNSYAAATVGLPDKILLGNVLYPLNIKHFDVDEVDFLNYIDSTGIVLKFDVGDLNITPNRESIIYTTDTINKIKSKIAECRKELFGKLNTKLTKDFDDIFDYFSIFDNTIRYDPVLDELDNNNFTYETLRVKLTDLDSSALTYKGKDVKKYNNEIRTINKTCIPTGLRKGVITDTRVITSDKVPYSYKNNIEYRHKKIIAVEPKFRFLAPIKAYLKEKYEGYTVIVKPTYDEFRKSFPYISAAPTGSPDTELEDLIKSAYEDFTKKLVTIDFNTDKDYLAYKEELTNSKDVVITDSVIYLYEYSCRGGGWNYRREFKSYDEVVKYIKSFKKGIVLSYIEGDVSGIATYVTSRGYVLFTAKKPVMKALMEEDFINRIDLSYLLYKEPCVSEISSIVKCAEGMSVGVCQSDWECVKNTVPKTIRDEISNMIKDWGKYSNYFFIEHVKRLDLPIDPHIEYLFERMLFYIRTYNSAVNEVSQSGIISDLIAETLIIKRGSYRVSYRTYREYKNNKIIQTLCKK